MTRSESNSIWFNSVERSGHKCGGRKKRGAVHEQDNPAVAMKGHAPLTMDTRHLEATVSGVGCEGYEMPKASAPFITYAELREMTREQIREACGRPNV